MWCSLLRLPEAEVEVVPALKIAAVQAAEVEAVEARPPDFLEGSLVLKEVHRVEAVVEVRQEKRRGRRCGRPSQLESRR